MGEHEASQGNVDHGFGNVEAPFMISDEPLPTGHPAEGAFHDPSVGQDLETRLPVGAADDLDDEIAIDCGVQEAGAIIGAIGEEMPEPRPALADGSRSRIISSMARSPRPDSA